ncbi:chitinase 3 precursor, putative [Cordyceps militaris CM01]|uniref:chitinase n=1 Tax=Cordyceps militaris (strain CM01) TaxID=983644 RepID=G3JBL0_CORMM|nr:chitinase 3 precursor, putative [Cordyceps militaris CM01]EGX95315.1 chitinase 3 precursor, putative [Cordyceps militaris CM01]
MFSHIPGVDHKETYFQLSQNEMRSLSLLARLGLTSLVAASTLAVHQAPGAQNVVYWGQNGGGTIENNDLGAYCQSNSGIDVLVLAFLYQFGHDNTIPSGTVGQSCSISNAGAGQNCEALVAAIGKCQAAGVKIVLSLGGATSSYSLQSQAQAEKIGQYLWDSYGNSGNTKVQRPFGKNAVDGFDFDIELNGGSSQYYQYMIAKLRQNFAKDSSKKYVITGAPQCPIPEPNMGEIIAKSQFDYLFVQFYNNNNYSVPCALPINGNAPFNYNNWTSFIASTPSKDAKIFIGVPASTLAANGSPSGATYYATPAQLATIVNDYKSDAHFGGIMMWSAGFSDSNVINGCTYAQEAKHILVNGGPCGSGGPPPPSSTTSAPPGGSPLFAAGFVPNWHSASMGSVRRARIQWTDRVPGPIYLQEVE